MNRFAFRTASAVGVASFAIFVLGLTPFLAAGPSAGAVITNQTQTVVVDRSLKGDRLSMTNQANVPLSSSVLGSNALRLRMRSEQAQQIPVGCDRAFSPVAAPSLASVYRRCMT